MLDQPAEQVLPERVEDVGDVGVVACGLMFRERCIGFAGQRLGEVGGEHLGVKILTDGFREFAAELLEVKPMLQEFECFFDIPLKMPP